MINRAFLRLFLLYNYFIHSVSPLTKDCEKANMDLSQKYLDTKEDLAKKSSTQFYGWIAFGGLIAILAIFKIAKSRLF